MLSKGVGGRKKVVPYGERGGGLLYTHIPPIYELSSS